MKMRIAGVSLAIVFAALPARAQGPGGPPPNYQQLVTQIADLQARVSKLEGNIVASDLAGTYAFVGLDTAMTAFHAGVPSIPATISTTAFRATLVLNADGTGTVAEDDCEGTTLTQGTWALSPVNCTESGPGALTWTYSAGAITIDFGNNEQIPFYVSVGGRVLVQVGGPFHPSDPSSDQLLFLATRLR